MIVLITCRNGITGNSLVYRLDFFFGNRVIHSLINATLILVSICSSDAEMLICDGVGVMLLERERGRWRRQTIGIGGCLNEDDFGFGNHLLR